jgi:hypothetical protein
MVMYGFRIVVHPRAGELSTSVPVTIHGRQVRPLAISPEAAGQPFRVTFDYAAEILSTLPRMFLEPDGSFVWTGEHEGGPWQVDGLLVDQGQRLAYMELSGRCPANEFDQLLAPLGWPAAPVMFQLVPEAVFVDEPEFRRLASQPRAKPD